MAGDETERSKMKAEPADRAERSHEGAPASEAKSIADAGKETAGRSTRRESAAGEGGGPRSAPAKSPLSSLWPLAAAIVVGAGLAVGGAFGLRYFDNSSSAAADRDLRIADLNARLDWFEQQADALETSERSALAGVVSRVDEVESAAGKAAAESSSALRNVQEALSELARTPAPGVTADVGPLETRIQAVEKKLASLEAASVQAPGVASEVAVDLAPVQTRLDALEKKFASVETELAHAPAGAPDVVVDLGPVQARLDALEKKLASLETASLQAPGVASEAAVDLAPLQTRLAAVETKLASVETEVAHAPGAALDEALDLGPLQTRLAAIESKLASVETEVAHAPAAAPDEALDLGPLQTRLAAVESTLASVESELSAPKAAVSADQDGVDSASQIEEGAHARSVAIVAQSLLRRLDRGVPFPAEFATLEALGGGKAELAPLRPFAATGVASPRELEEQFSILAAQVAAGDTGGERKSLLARLTSEAARFVHIRRVGDVDADDADAPLLVAQIEKALARLDIEDAFTIWTELPDASKAKSESWGQAAKARLDALNAARSLEADAVAALGKPKS